MEEDTASKVSLSAENEEGDTAPKLSLSVEHDMDTKAQSPIQQDRPTSPVPSCVSMKSDWSMNPPIRFSNKDSTAEQIIQLPRPASPVPSCVSMKSDWSMNPPIRFKDKDITTEQKSQQDRPASPVPSCVSMKSDWSMNPPIRFKDKDITTEQKSQQDRPASPVPSCVSMKSDWSMNPPIRFSNTTEQQNLGRLETEAISEQSDQPHQEILSTFMLLEENIIDFVKNELKRYKMILSSGLPDGSDGQREEAVDTECQRQRRNIREGALKMTLNFLRIMKQNQLADTLEKNELAVICQHELKSKLKNTFQTVFEGVARHGNKTLLSTIYTDLHITEDEKLGFKDEQMRQIKSTSKKSDRPETPISCKDIFKTSTGRGKPIRTVLTKGDAGIGKTISVHQFILDWAEGKTNGHIQFIFPLLFRDLNVMKMEEISIMGLIHQFFSETRESGITNYDKHNVLFVFDGLDECRLPLDFQNNKTCSDVTQPNSVDVLLTNLIRGNLLPSASVWITTRPAAANQIPADCVDRVMEIQGFNDAQKKEYFMKKISDQSLASRVISHIKNSKFLDIMSEVPVFSCTCATVLEHLLRTNKEERMPKTVTEMYTHFLVLQTKKKNVKYHGKTETDPHWDGESIQTICSLGKMAFQQLNKGNLHFYEEDLKECGINVRDASVYSGVFTQIFREQRGIFQEKIFRFTYQSMQEYLAALFVFLSFINDNENWMKERCFRLSTSTEVKPLSMLYKSAVNKALESENGHLDYFLRFLLGFSMESNQTLLRGLLKQTLRSSQDHKDTVKYIKQKIRENPSPERCINLFHCLNELNECSLMEEVQHYLSSGCCISEQLSSTQWSALVFVLLTSEEGRDVFDLKKYSRSEDGLLRLLPVVKDFSTVRLDNCNLSERCSKSLASALKCSEVKELDLSHNDFQDSGVKILSSALGRPQLEKLRLSQCGVKKEGCASLVSALQSNASNLKELDLSYNHLQDSGINVISSGLKDPPWTLMTLWLSGCLVTEKGCGFLSTALKSNPNHLKELDLSDNDLQDSGVNLLSAGLGNPLCKLETLRLSRCLVTEEGCGFLSTALMSNPNHLRELDLSGNDLQDSGVNLLSAGLGNPLCKLQTLRLSRCLVTEEGCGFLSTALKSNPNHLRKLDLSDNDLHDSGVTLLSAGLGNPLCKLESLRLSGCLVTEVGCASLASALRSNPSHLRELDLSYNHPRDKGLKLLSAELENPHCKLKKLYVDHGGEIRIKPGLRKYACELTLDLNTVNKRLSLSDENRKVTWTTKKHSYPKHPERFQGCSPQVLCREGLSGRCYWEAEWNKGVVSIGMTYKGISRTGGGDDSRLGSNNKSWSLSQSGESYAAWHNEESIPVTSSVCNRVGVYLDWPAGTLSFYRVSSDIQTHLYTFHTTFTEPLYPGFRVPYNDSSVSLCQVE